MTAHRRRPHPPLPPAPEIEFTRHRLANGLDVVLHQDRALPLVAINLWVHVGSKNEWPGRTGLAHLFEHMLFQGSAHVGANQHFAYVQQVGGVANGSTWYDRTNYYETLPARALELGLWLESDRLGFLLPALDEAKLERQRQVVLNERRQRVDNQPYGRAMEALFERLYPAGHPYRWPVIGYGEDIAAATRDEIADFFRRHYAPNHTVLSLCGDFEAAAALDAVERWFGDLAAGPPVAPVEAPLPERAGDIEPAEIADRVQLERVYLAWTLPPLGHPDWWTASLLVDALAGGKSSPLVQDLVHRREIAQDVSAFLYPTEIAATLVAVATAKPGADLAAIEAALLARFEEAAAHPPDEDDWETARRRLLASAYDDLESLGRKADLLSQSATYFGDPGAFRHQIEAYRSLDRLAVLALQQRWLRPERRATVRVRPGEGAG